MQRDGERERERERREGILSQESKHGGRNMGTPTTTLIRNNYFFFTQQKKLLRKELLDQLLKNYGDFGVYSKYYQERKGQRSVFRKATLGAYCPDP